jgi:hypothetical protein
VRLVDQAATGDATVGLGAELLRTVAGEPTHLPSDARARVAAELAHVPAFQKRAPMWSLAAAAALLLVAVGGAVAVHWSGGAPGRGLSPRPHPNAMTSVVPARRPGVPAGTTAPGLTAAERH